MLHWMPIWKRIRQLTNKDVERGAVDELKDHLENLIDEELQKAIAAALEEHRNFNDNLRNQGLDPKKRIDQGCIRRAIKSLKIKRDTSPQDSEGGLISSKTNIFMQSPDKKDFIGGNTPND